MERSNSPSLLSLFGTVGVLLVILIFVFIGLATEDAGWFLTSFKETPEEIAIYCYGEQKTIPPEDPAFGPLVTVVNSTLSTTKNYDPLTLSDVTYAEYQTSPVMLVMELYYFPPVRVHSFYKYFSNLDSIVIPLVGRHADTHAIFGRANGFGTAGSLHFARIPEILKHLTDNGLCIQP